MKIHQHLAGHITKMAAMPIYGKNPLNPSFQEPLGRFWWNFVWSIRDLSPLLFVQIITLGWPWPILRQGQILQLRQLCNLWQWWILWKLFHPVTWNLVNKVNWMSNWRIMSNQGQGLLSHVYLGFVCCVLIQVQDIRWAFTGPLVLWFANVKTKAQISWAVTARLISAFVFAT